MWYGIRKANIGLQHLNDMKDCTTEEYNLIAGQLYFFRGWFHFMLMQYFGGLPYIDHVLSSSSTSVQLPRLSYQECADKVAEDLKRAALLLPTDWDDTTPGQIRLERTARGSIKSWHWDSWARIIFGQAVR